MTATAFIPVCVRSSPAATASVLLPPLYSATPTDTAGLKVRFSLHTVFSPCQASTIPGRRTATIAVLSSNVRLTNSFGCPLAWSLACYPYWLSLNTNAFDVRSGTLRNIPQSSIIPSNVKTDILAYSTSSLKILRIFLLYNLNLSYH